MTSPPRKQSFRTALLVLVLGSLALTVGIIGVVAFWNSTRSVEELRTRQYQLMARLMETEVNRLLAIAPKLLAVMRAQTERGLQLGGDNNLRGELLAESLRAEPALSWLSFADAETGRFSGAWRDAEGRIVVNTSDPQVDGGRPREFFLEPSGERTPLDRGLPAGYEPRDMPWFIDAVESDKPVWSELYVFYSGEPGLTVSVAARKPDTGKVIGVFTADYTLSAIHEFLHSLVAGASRVLVLIMPDGQLIESASSVGDDLATHTAVTISAVPVPPSVLKEGEPVVFKFELEGESMIGVAERLEPVPGFSCVAVIATDEREFFGGVLTNARMTAALGLGAIFCAALISFLLAGRLARPLAEISADLANIALFDLEKRSRVPSFVHEIDVVGENVDRMKAGLRSFGKYVPTTLVKRLLAQGMDAEIGAVDRELTIVFADLAGFTAISEKLPPAQTVEEMRDYFQLATEAVEGHQGTLDKFIGDGVLAFFNAPLDVEDHAAKACSAALEIRDRLAAAAMRRAEEGRPLLKVRFGINTGEVLVGNIGTADRFAYTVFGDPVNLASRLETLNKQYGTGILAGEATRAAAGDHFAWREIDRVAVLGRTEATTVYELIGRTDELSASQNDLCVSYENALRAYYAGDFENACKQFVEILCVHPDDSASSVLLKRCKGLAESPPADWSGVFIAGRK